MSDGADEGDGCAEEGEGEGDGTSCSGTGDWTVGAGVGTGTGAGTTGASRRAVPRRGPDVDTTRGSSRTSGSVATARPVDGGRSRKPELVPGSMITGPSDGAPTAVEPCGLCPSSETVPAATTTSVGTDVRATRIALISSGFRFG